MLPAGLAIVGFSDKAVAASKSNTLPRTFWSIDDMRTGYAANAYPYTPSVGLMNGLKLATEMLLAHMATAESRFREEILAAALLDQQSPVLKTLLSRGIVFQLPVPERVMTQVYEALTQWHKHQSRAIALGARRDWATPSE